MPGRRSQKWRRGGTRGVGGAGCVIARKREMYDADREESGAKLHRLLQMRQDFWIKEFVFWYIVVF